MSIIDDGKGNFYAASERLIIPEARYESNGPNQCDVCQRVPTRNGAAVVTFLALYDRQVLEKNRADGWPRGCPAPLLAGVHLCRRCALKLASSLEARVFDGRRPDIRKKRGSR